MRTALISAAAVVVATIAACKKDSNDGSVNYFPKERVRKEYRNGRLSSYRRFYNYNDAGQQISSLTNYYSDTTLTKIVGINRYEWVYNSPLQETSYIYNVDPITNNEQLTRIERYTSDSRNLTTLIETFDSETEYSTNTPNRISYYKYSFFNINQDSIRITTTIISKASQQSFADTSVRFIHLNTRSLQGSDIYGSFTISKKNHNTDFGNKRINELSYMLGRNYLYRDQNDGNWIYTHQFDTHNRITSTRIRYTDEWWKSESFFY